MSKSEFSVKTVKHLGFVIEAGKGMRVDPQRVETVKAWEAPKSVKDIRSFLSNGLLKPIMRSMKSRKDYAQRQYWPISIRI